MKPTGKGYSTISSDSCSERGSAARRGPRGARARGACWCLGRTRCIAYRDCNLVTLSEHRHALQRASRAAQTTHAGMPSTAAVYRDACMHVRVRAAARRPRCS